MIRKDLKIALVQADLRWENVDENLEHLEELLLKASADLIVLPEMFSTGFTMNPSKCAEEMDGKTFKWLRQIAGKKNAVVTGSVSVRESGKYFNRLFWMKPDGSFSRYDKRHLFRMGKEQDHYESGKSLLTEILNGWKIRPFICYDLRFPVWSRNQWNDDATVADYDVLLYVANWPEKRKNHWRQLLIARAIENQAFCIGVNRVGVDGNGIPYSGNTMIIDPSGAILAEADKPVESVLEFTLSSKSLFELRKKFPVGLDADTFKII